MEDKALIIGSTAWWLGGILSLANIGFSLITAGAIHGWFAVYCHLLTFILPCVLLATSFFAPPLPRRLKKYFDSDGKGKPGHSGVHAP